MSSSEKAELSDKALDLLGELHELNNAPDYGLNNFKFRLIELNGVYEKLLTEAKSLEDKDALNFLKLYEDNRRELIESSNPVNPEVSPDYRRDETYL